MRLTCEFDCPLNHSDPNQLIRHLRINVLIDSDYSNEEFVLGIIEADVLPLDVCERYRASIAEACDAESRAWHDLHQAFFDENDELRNGLDVSLFVNNVLYVRRSVLHEKLVPIRTGIYEAIGSLFGHATMLVLHTDELLPSELQELGFDQRDQHGGLLYSDFSYERPYVNKNPDGVDVTIAVRPTSDDAAWVRQQWVEQKVSSP